MRMRAGSVLALAAALTAWAAPAARAETGFLRRDWMAEAGIGGGVSRLFDDTGGNAGQNGASMRFTLSKGILPGLLVGYEMAGVLREGGPPDSLGAHFDTFLVDQVATVRWLPLGKARGPGALHLRAGVGRALARIERTAADDSRTNRAERGVATLLGVGYAFRLGSQVSIGLDATWSHLGLDGPTLDHATFLSSTFVLQWHSWPVVEAVKPRRTPR